MSARPPAFKGHSEMHARVNTLDWAATPLGPIDGWPQSLKATVKTLLSSRYPMVLIWGRELTQLYNDAYSQLIGDGHPAALGSDIRITLAEGWATLGPMIDEVMASGVANWVPALPLEMKRAGYREEAYFNVSHAPAEDDDGDVVGMLAVCSEVTQQVLSERRTRLLRELALRGSEARSVEKACGDLGAVMSRHGLDVPFALVYLKNGDQQLELRAEVGVDGSSLRDGARWPLDRALAGEVLEVSLDGHPAVRGGLFRDPVRSALVMPLPSSDPGLAAGAFVLGLSPSRALDEAYRSFCELLAGQVAVALRNARAHEDERRRVEALAELDRAKTSFFSNVSHEFRTPLTLILGPLEDALAATDTPQQRERLELIRRGAQRLFKLVNTLLDFSRLEAGRLNAEFEPVDLSALTAELASLFRSAAERAGLSLTIDAPSMPEPVFVDRDLWEKIVLNLISNALKYTFAGGITVSLRAVEGRAELRVRDTGVGIAPSEVPHVFERFFRGRGQPGRSHEGSGIGLSLVQELVSLHGGDTSVESALGEGTTFTVTIPFGSEHLPRESLKTRSEPRESPSRITTPFLEEVLRWLPPEAAPPTKDGSGALEPSRPRILVVDDNADLRAYVEGLLRPEYDVDTAADGIAALESIRKRLPELVLTDVMMPRLDGFGLLRELREDRRTRELPVILLSARAGEESAVEGVTAGADDYLVKPFSAKELLARVRSRLEVVRMRRQAARDAEAISLRDEFLEVASHEFRTPLTALNLQLEGLHGAAQGSTRQKALVAQRQADRLASLIEELLSAFQIAAGQLHLERAEFDLASLLTEVAERFRAIASEEGSSLTVSVPRPLRGQWDRAQLDHALSNLLSNAIKFGAGRPIEITVSEAGGQVGIAVHDEGIGIAPRDQARIFERFERAASVEHYSGLGLGLYIARAIASAHGGSVEVDSQNGAGTTFTMSLPFAFTSANT